MKTRLIIVCIAIIILLNTALASDYNLLSNLTTPSQSDFNKHQSNSESIKAKKMMECDVNDEMLTPNQVKCHDNIIIKGITSKDLRCLVDKTDVNLNSTYTIRAKIKDYPLAYAIITSTDGKVLGDIHIPELKKKFIIISNSPYERAKILEPDANSNNILEDSESLVPYSQFLDNSADNDLPAMLGDTTTPTTVDVMIVYTPNAMNWANGSGGGISNVVAQAMAKAQLALDNSLTNTKFRLVNSSLITYTESGSSNTDLDRFTTYGDGYLDEIQTLRNQYNADVCTIFTQCDDTGGLAWLLTTASGLPNNAFNLIRVQQAGWTYSYVHEVGHNMGCHHRRDQVTQPGPGLFSYSAGWRWIGTNSGKYCSVMSYEEDGYSRVGYFSNPSVLYMGVPTGSATDDNARTIREIKDVVSNYKIPVTGITLSKSTLQLNKNANYTLTATITPSNATNKVITWSSSNTAVATVNSIGKVTAVGYETCSITVTTADGGKTAVCIVTVANLSGIIDLQNYGGNILGLPVVITVTDANNAVETFNTTLDAVGTYYVGTTLKGACTIRAKCSHWLTQAKLLSIANITYSVNFSLINGDCDNDNAVDESDFGAISMAWYSIVGNINYDVSADLNADGSIDESDFGILSYAWYQVGA